MRTRRAPPGRGSACALALLLCAASPGSAADFSYSNFASADATLRMVGVANRTDDRLRLTPAKQSLAGAAWHAEKASVEGGFSADFSLRIFGDEGVVSSPCRTTENLPELCERRGGDGLAFVVQNVAAGALGGPGGAMGYGGMHNALAVELDTWFDADARDPYQNHVAVLTAGTGQLSAAHAVALGSTVRVPDLADGEVHFVRVSYEPEFHPAATLHPAFKAAPQVGRIASGRARTPALGKGALGTLAIFVDDLSEPVLVVPVNLANTLELDNGRAWLGFTAATGEAVDNHEILSWSVRERLSETMAFTARAGEGVRPDVSISCGQCAALRRALGPAVRRARVAAATTHAPTRGCAHTQPLMLCVLTDAPRDSGTRVEHTCTAAQLDDPYVPPRGYMAVVEADNGTAPGDDFNPTLGDA